MKTTFLILVMVFMVGIAFSVLPAEKPFATIKIDGTTQLLSKVIDELNEKKTEWNPLSEPTAPSGDEWFQKQNVKASGGRNNSVQEKLTSVQSAIDSVEHNMLHLKLQVVQQNIRNLQLAISDLKAAIDAAKSSNPTYKINVTFIGLPSDRPFKDIASIAAIKNSWSALELFLGEQKQAIEKLPTESTPDSKKELARLISTYSDWQSKLPEKTNGLLNQYAPDIHTDSLNVPHRIALFNKENTDYAQTLNDYKAFIDYRIREVPTENQNINAVNNRIQAIRLFDGMLRSYFNSISWAEWINTRE